MSERKNLNPFRVIWAAAGVSAVLGVLVTLLGVAYVRQKQLQESALKESMRANQAATQARDAANRGNRARDEAEALVEFLLDDLSAELEAIGRSDLLMAAARKTVDYFEKLPPELHTPKSLSKQAFILTTLAQAHYAQGDHRAATNAMHRSIQLRKQLVAAGDPSGEHTFDLSREISELGLFHNSDGDQEGARTLFREALRLLETPPPGAVLDGHWEYGRATVHMGMGEVDRLNRNFEGALENYQKASLHLEVALLQQPDKVNWLKKRMNLHNNSGVAQMYEGQFRKAQAEYLAALTTARELVLLEPQNRRWEKELATTLMNLGTCLDEQEDFKAAEPLIREALSIRQGLAEWDSKNARTMRDLAHVWRNLSSLQFSTEQNQKALLSCRNSLIAYRRLLTLDPGRERWITDMRRSTERFQDWLVAAGMTEAALELIRETTSFAERNRSSTPGADVWDDLLARLYADQGQLAKGQGSGADLEAWLNSLKRRTALLDADPESTTALYQWALACLQLGRSYRLSGLASPARVCLRLGNLSLKEMIPAGHAQRDLYLDLLDRELFLTYRDLGVVPESSALVKAGAAWRYWDRRTPPANDWIALDHSEADWAQGSAPFGYGEPDLGTVISFGDDPSNKPLTAWFRHTFEVTDPGAIKTLKVSLRRDDGAMVYLNGQELFRDGLPDGIIEPSATARMVQGLEEEVYHVRLLGKDRFMLHAGHNVLAVEVHQNESQSSDLIMDLEMVANPRNHLEDSALTVQEVEEVLRDALPVLISKRL